MWTIQIGHQKALYASPVNGMNRDYRLLTQPECLWGFCITLQSALNEIIREMSRVLNPVQNLVQMWTVLSALLPFEQKGYGLQYSPWTIQGKTFLPYAIHQHL